MAVGVVPVNVLGRELLCARRLDSVNPSGNGELSLTLQECGVGTDELLRLLLRWWLVLSLFRLNLASVRLHLSICPSVHLSSQVKWSSIQYQSLSIHTRSFDIDRISFSRGRMELISQIERIQCDVQYGIQERVVYRLLPCFPCTSFVSTSIPRHDPSFSPSV